MIIRQKQTLFSEDTLIYDRGQPVCQARNYNGIYVLLPLHDERLEDPIIDKLIEEYLDGLRQLNREINRISTDVYRHGRVPMFYRTDRASLFIYAYNSLIDSANSVGFRENKVDSTRFLQFNNVRNIIGKLFNMKTQSETELGTNNRQIIEKVFEEKIEMASKSKITRIPKFSENLIKICNKFLDNYKKFKKKNDRVNAEILGDFLFKTNYNFLDYVIPMICMNVILLPDLCEDIFRKIDNKYNLHPEQIPFYINDESFMSKFKRFIRGVGSYYSNYTTSESADFMNYLEEVLLEKDIPLYENIKLSEFYDSNPMYDITSTNSKIKSAFDFEQMVKKWNAAIIDSSREL